MRERMSSLCLITMMMVMVVDQFQPTLCQDFLESFDSVGTEFYLGFMSIGGKHEGLHEPEIIISTSLEKPVHVKVTTPGLDPEFERFVTVSRGQSATVVLSKDVRGVHTELASRAVHVTADGPVTVLGVNKEWDRQDSYLASPLQALGRHYLVLTYTNRPLMVLVATEDNTTVNVTLPRNQHLNIIYNEWSYKGGDTLSLTLNRYDTFHVRQHHELADLTGSLIVSNKRLVVLSGNELIWVGSKPTAEGHSLDHLSEMLLPVEAWGTRFCLPHTPNRGRVADVYRVLASQDNTRFVLGDGTVKTIQQAGQFEELSLPHDVFLSLQSDKPVAVAMFSKQNGQDKEHPDYEGDSAMTLVVPESLYRDSYAWGTPTGPGEKLLHSVSVLIDERLLPGLRMDGQSVTWEAMEKVQGCSKVWVYVNTDQGSHVMDHQDLGVRFFAMASGLVMESVEGQGVLSYLCPLGFGQGHPKDCHIGGDPHLRTYHNTRASLNLPCAYRATRLTVKNTMKLPWHTYYSRIRVDVVAGNGVHVPSGRFYITDIQVKVTFLNGKVEGPSNTYFTGQNDILNDNPWSTAGEDSMQDRVVLSYESSQQRATLRITGTSIRLQYYVISKRRKHKLVPAFDIEVVDDNDLIFDGSIGFPKTMCSTVHVSSPFDELDVFGNEATYAILQHMEPNIPFGQQDAVCPTLKQQFSDCPLKPRKTQVWDHCFKFIPQSHSTVKCLLDPDLLMRTVSACVERVCFGEVEDCEFLQSVREKCPSVGNIADVEDCPQ